MSQPTAISVSRRIPAPAGVIFAFLTDPAKHPAIDGSGMLTSASSGSTITGVGDTFTMRMHNDEMGDYEMINHVVEYESGRLITWEPVLLHAGRVEDEADVGVRSGHRWSYQLEPVSSDSTMVTEAYDCARAPAWLQKAVRGGQRWEASMEISLENLCQLCSNGAD